ncbi:MAG: hypothetical protein ACKOCX_02575 [Planctomycetota bacterium]
MTASMKRQALLMAVILACVATGARGQLGQTAMPAPDGLIGRAAQGLAMPDGEFPGWLYYGINGADRGLGYNGSYMTLGGFIPYAEDDLGGFWAADLRGHLSVHGGFFSNVGAVRKQFIGGTLLGIGVYWDYDGDMNQYPTGGAIGTSEYGQFGHAYNQVGISGEWLTDYGNIRSNGYIPVGTTAYTVGAPGSPFAANYLLCQYGLDAALAGTDLEVGAYIPGLADWAGMVSVGGYAYGNARYDWWQGSQIGQDVVPWFGGVYTRLDLTLLENWDFSLQANNDSYFDWTGFARLTYRMGGSRRRNVPDQVEQPMMRNEHIVRAHQTPIVAVNPVTNQPWNVIHVDNTAALGGSGTAEAPVQTLAAAQTRATQPYDIVYVHVGASATQPYESAWQFQANDQILVGQGSTLELNTVNCGPRQFFSTPTNARPVLTSAGTAITLRNGVVVDHFRIQNAAVGIAAGNSVTGAVNVNDVQMVSTNTTGGSGVVLTNVAAGAEINLFNMSLENMNSGLIVDGGAADIDFQGMIKTEEASDASIRIENTSGGTININRTSDTLQTPIATNQVVSVAYSITDTNSQFAAPIMTQSMIDTNVNIGRASIVAPLQRGVLIASNVNSQVRFIDLQVEEAGGVAFETQANNAASLVAIAGTGNSLSSLSDTLPAFASNDDAVLDIELASLESAVEPGFNAAIVLQGASTGFFTISEQFLVQGTPGTVAGDVTNTTGVSVAVPAP